MGIALKVALTCAILLPPTYLIAAEEQTEGWFLATSVLIVLGTIAGVLAVWF